MVATGLVQAYAATVTLAVIPIILGSFGSLTTSKRSQRLLAESKGESVSLEKTDDDDEVERIGFADAYMFPVMGSCLLGGLYLIFKFVDRTWINWAIGWYFTATALPAVLSTSSTLINYLTPKVIANRLPHYDVSVKDRTTKLFSIPVPFLSLLSIPLSLAVPYFYVTESHPWWANNIMGFSFAHNAIQLMRLDGMITGATLLGGLFLYDIFWVFGTAAVLEKSVMVEVATGLDAPIKLLFPKDSALTSAAGFTMLGLGDIIIPGVFLALALRLDFSLHSRAHPTRPLTPSNSFPKPYFIATLAAYVAGLATTIIVMHTTRAAQPALLYLSPMCVGAVALTSFLRKEWSTVWGWGDGEDDELEDKWRADKLALSSGDSSFQIEADGQVPLSNGSGSAEKVGTGQDDGMRLRTRTGAKAA